MKDHEPPPIRADAGFSSPDAVASRAECRLLFKLAALAIERDDLGHATDLLRHLQTTCPDNPLYLRALGEVLLEQRLYDEALVCLQRSLALSPLVAETHFFAGLAAQALGQVQSARQYYARAADLDPAWSEAWFNLGTVYLQQGETALAEEPFRRCMQTRPDWPPAWLNLGKCYYDLGRYQDAGHCYERAIAIDPDYAQAWYNLAATRLNQGDHDAMITCYRKVVDLQPNHDAAHLNLAVALRRKERIDEALVYCKRSLAITPQFLEARAFLFQLAQHACDWQLADKVGPFLDKDTRHCLGKGLKPGESPMLSLRRHGDPSRHLEIAKAWSHRISCETKSKYPGLHFDVSPKRYTGERLRIGYISNDFKDHAVAHQVRGLLAAHDRRRFEVFAYACNPPGQSLCQERIRQACDHFVPLHGLSDEAAARRIYSDRIQLLVDMMGHTQGSRLPVLALRPAPVQIGYLGFLGTSGADFIDYFITDKVVTPADQARLYTEKLVFLPHCYQVNDDAMPEPAARYKRSDFGLGENAVVFCCFNQPYKIDRALFGAWMTILRSVPNGVLWLLNQNSSAVRNLKQAAVNAGIEPHRLIFSGALRIDKHLSRLLLADIALDPFTYNGGATTSNALWAGLPVITLMGSHLLSRMSASALLAVELERLIAHTPEQYVQKVVELAHAPQKRQAIRYHLQQGRSRFPLFNTALFARHLMSAYVRIWDHYRNGLTAASFSIKSLRTSAGDITP